MCAGPRCSLSRTPGPGIGSGHQSGRRVDERGRPACCGCFYQTCPERIGTVTTRCLLLVSIALDCWHKETTIYCGAASAGHWCICCCLPTRTVDVTGTAMTWGFPATSMQYIMDGAATLLVYSAAVVIGQLGACWTMSKVVGCNNGTMPFAQVFGLTFYVPPPPSAGAVVLTALQILAGYQQPISSFSGGTGLQRVVEALKHAFALRLRMGDPGTCGGGALAGTPAGDAAHCYLDLKSLLDDLLSPDFAASLRCVFGPQMFFGICLCKLYKSHPFRLNAYASPD